MEAFLSFVSANAPSIESVAAVILVAITVLALNESRKARKDSSLPFVVCKEFTVRTPGNGDACCVKVDAENLGKGIALNVLISFSDVETKREVLSAAHYIPYLHAESKDETRVHIPQEFLEHLRFDGKGEATLKGLVKFEDAYGRKFSYAQIYVYRKKDAVIVPVLGKIKFRQISFF